MVFLDSIEAPTTKWKIKDIRTFINEHNLSIETKGKGKNKKTIVLEIKQALIKKEIPKDLVSYLFSFLDLKQRTQLSVISHKFHKCVISTNQNDGDVEFAGLFRIGNCVIF